MTKKCPVCGGTGEISEDFYWSGCMENGTDSSSWRMSGSYKGFVEIYIPPPDTTDLKGICHPI